MERMILFDFDGTLCDSEMRSLQIVNGLASQYHFRKVELSDLGALKQQSVRAILRELKIPLLKIPQMLVQAKIQFGEQLELLQPIPGMVAVIAKIRAAGIPLGIITSNAKNNVERFLQQSKMEGFDFIYGDSSLYGKAAVIKRIMKKYKKDPATIVYIGDEIRDIEAARAAGIKSIAVSWGYNAQEVLRQSQPDWLVTTPEELAAVLLAQDEALV